MGGAQSRIGGKCMQADVCSVLSDSFHYALPCSTGKQIYVIRLHTTQSDAPATGTYSGVNRSGGGLPIVTRR